MIFILLFILFSVIRDGGFRCRARFCPWSDRCRAACGPRDYACDCRRGCGSAPGGCGAHSDKYADGGFGPRPGRWE